MMRLQDPVRALSGIGPKTEPLFQKLGIRTIGDLLLYYPFRYDHYTEPQAIRSLVPGKSAVIEASLSKTPTFHNAGGRKLMLCEVSDGTGSVELAWFQMTYMKNRLKPGMHFFFRGKVELRGRKLHMNHPEVLTKEQYFLKKQALQPVYSLTRGLSLSLLQKCMRQALSVMQDTNDYLPLGIRRREQLISLKNAIEEIHFPKSYETMAEARRRLVFDEFLLFGLSVERLRNVREENSCPMTVEGSDGQGRILQFLAGLSFTLTGAQKKVWSEILTDLTGAHRMNRLIQGDVGSGKTILALMAALLAKENGYQAAIMAPTEVLAEQHYESFTELLKNYQCRIVLLTGSMKESEKRVAREQIASGEAQIVIGTHALIQEKVRFQHLGLVVTDEQHRFGVHQRELLMEKGGAPHILVMSATPIPRTLALILYGDLDISVLDELPAGRKPIKNAVVGTSYQSSADRFLAKEIAAGHQAYVICPMIEENEGSDLTDVGTEAERLRQALPGDVRIGMLHGQLSAAEKATVMRQFHDHELDLLVSTTVVEVGVNVPNATVMLIYDAERFGLAALHQLRGRIGRGDAQSYCIFMSGTDQPEAMERLQILGSTNDGFRIAEQDLTLRGPGDMFGLRQSGEERFRIGDLMRDADLLKKASEVAKSLPPDQAEKLFADGEAFYHTGEAMAAVADVL